MTDFKPPSFSFPEGSVPATPEDCPPPLEDVPPGGGQGREDVNTIVQQAFVEQHVEDRKAERKLRRKYAGLAFRFAVGGSLFWAVLLLWSGCASYYTTKPPFSDNVLIAITTATSVNLFAAFLGVIRGLFPANGKK
ncbi:hypothetical protein ACM7KY_30750 [Pseudomonas aeruginosa]|uniref:hypothetical protein n=1 Tax=Pseudomonas aeruginosa TaxID=287 RepID=UPI001F4A0BC6|nr:hypothetical protein [Pseudomonas aeruginosa]